MCIRDRISKEAQQLIEVTKQSFFTGIQFAKEGCHLHEISNAIAAYLSLIHILIPILCSGFFNASVSFGGTSIIIIVGVVLETLKQIEAQLCNRYYKGFLSE